MKKIINIGLVLSLFCTTCTVMANETAVMDEYIPSTVELEKFKSQYAPFVTHGEIIDIEPSLLYNNELVGNPIIKDNRTMLPFRELLEEIGATVNYEEKARIVSAEKDGITVSFSLDDTYLDITKDGVTERITQDVANVVIEDTVYVPVRFISEAFNLNVGWSQFEKTAIIVDFEEYIRKLSEESPNFAKYNEIVSNFEIPESYTQTVELSFDIDSKMTEAENIKINFGIVGATDVNSDMLQADVDVDFSAIGILGTGESVNLQDVSIDFIKKDETIYVKTNIVDKLSEVMPEERFTELDDVKKVITAETWFEVDIYEIMSELGLPEETIEMISNSFQINNNFRIVEKMKQSLEFGISSTLIAMQIDSCFDIFAKLYEEGVKITDNGDENYRVDLNISTELMAEWMAIPMDAIGDLTCYVKGYEIYEKGIQKSTGMTLEIKADVDGESMNINAESKSELIPDTNKEINIPEAAVDLLNAIKLLGEIAETAEI